MFRKIILLVWFSLLAFSLMPSPLVHAQTSSPQIIVLTADGPITPAMAQYLSRGIKIAERQGAVALIFQLNTPGGSITTMDDMEQTILASTVPVIVYVAPSGAMAASAGTIITLAGHASAMAPNAIIGAASPVGGQGENLATTEELKQKNALAATARDLTQRRGKTAMTLAEDTIQNAVAVSSSEALQAGLIDFISTDLNELRSQLDGFIVTVAGQPVTLHTANATFEPINISLIEQTLLIVTDPNIVFLLITIGVQAIIIEISSPGGWVAGFMGVVCLGLATYGLGILPVNWFGLLHCYLLRVIHPGYQSAHPWSSHGCRDRQPDCRRIGIIQHSGHSKLPARLGSFGGGYLVSQRRYFLRHHDDRSSCTAYTHSHR
jgi:membrane-bound serine protease (ClpP class)